MSGNVGHARIYIKTPEEIAAQERRESENRRKYEQGRAKRKRLAKKRKGGLL
jgi:hypothetical protein